MSTPAVVSVPAPVVAAVPVVKPAAPAATLNPVSAFLKNHEALLIVVFSLLLFWLVSGRVENILADHDNINLQKAKVAAAQQEQVDTNNAAVVAQQAADFKTLNTKILAQDAAIAQTNRALVAALAKQQQSNNNLTVPELLPRWEQLVPGSGVSIANGQTIITDAGAHATVNVLEQVPVLTQQLTNETKVADNANTLLAASVKQVFTLNDQVSGLTSKIVDDDKVCKQEIKTVKDAARKSKRRWFIGGFIAGFASRQAIKTYFGL